MPQRLKNTGLSRRFIDPFLDARELDRPVYMLDRRRWTRAHMATSPASDSQLHPRISRIDDFEHVGERRNMDSGWVGRRIQVGGNSTGGLACCLTGTFACRPSHSFCLGGPGVVL